MPKDENINNPEDQTNDDNKDTKGTSAGTENTEDTLKIPKSRFDEVNEERKELRQQLEDLKKAREEAEKASLEEKQEYKTLYEKAQEKLAQLEPLAKKVSSWKETMESLLQAQVEEIPEDMRTLIPEDLSIEKKLAWLAKNKAKIMKPVAPDVGAGKTGSGSTKQTVTLTPEQHRMAEGFGLTDEEYIEFMDETD